MGMLAMFAMVGGMVAPHVLVLQDVYAGLPLLVFGALSIIAGTLALALPEPTGKPLPQDFGNTAQR